MCLANNEDLHRAWINGWILSMHCWVQAKHGPTQRTLATSRGSLYTNRTDHVSIFIFIRHLAILSLGFFQILCKHNVDVEVFCPWHRRINDQDKEACPQCGVLRPVPWPRILEPEFIMERLAACGAAFRNVGNGLTSSSYHGRIKDIIQATIINVEDSINRLSSADLCDNST